jgi:hypothetical protein
LTALIMPGEPEPEDNITFTPLGLTQRGSLLR